ncbi:MAG: 4-hydroxybenzoyl-CoA reductase subunit beta [Burkholderiaceae bacterium]
MERMPSFELHRPSALAEVTDMLAANDNARLLAGGTDLLPNLRRGIERPGVVIDLGAVAALAEVRAEDNGLAVGAGVTLTRLASDPQIERQYPAISQAAGSVAGRGHRNAATVGGNLCLDTRCVFYNQSEWWRAANDYCLKRGGKVCHVAPLGERCHAAFSGDLAPALLVLASEVELASVRGLRRLPLAELYRDDGAAHLTMARDEILTRVFIPVDSQALSSRYRKARVRAATDFPLAGVAVAVAMHGDRIGHLRVALTGTNAMPFLIAGCDELIGHPVKPDVLGRLGKLIQKQAGPMRTTVTQSNYRRQVAAVLAQRLLDELANPV